MEKGIKLEGTDKTKTLSNVILTLVNENGEDVVKPIYLDKFYDIITLEYTKPDSAIPTTKTFQSNNYKYWYEHTFDKDNEGKFSDNVEIKSANIKIDNVTYINVDSIYVNGELVMPGVKDGYVSVEVEL